MKISCNMIVKNESLFVRHALKSILDVSDEIIVIDNDSTDETPKIVNSFFEEALKNYKQKTFVFLRNNSNDIAELRNECIRWSGGEFILICDGDEVFYNSGLNDIKKCVKDVEQVYLESNARIRRFFLPFHHFYGSFEYTLIPPPNPVVRIFKNDVDMKWQYMHPSLKIHEEIHGRINNDSIGLNYRFAHYGYCKPNKDIWDKGRSYQDKGHRNCLWERNVDEVLNDTSVKQFFGDHPEAMDDFPFKNYEGKTILEYKKGCYYIKKKMW